MTKRKMMRMIISMVKKKKNKQYIFAQYLNVFRENLVNCTAISSKSTITEEILRF